MDAGHPAPLNGTKRAIVHDDRQSRSLPSARDDLAGGLAARHAVIGEEPRSRHQFARFPRPLRLHVSSVQLGPVQRRASPDMCMTGTDVDGTDN
jgi:hypothetical protein